jgi:predicted DNA-binding protein YlxM (UPF0122 family)
MGQNKFENDKLASQNQLLRTEIYDVIKSKKKLTEVYEQFNITRRFFTYEIKRLKKLLESYNPYTFEGQILILELEKEVNLLSFSNKELIKIFHSIRKAISFKVAVIKDFEFYNY